MFKTRRANSTRRRSTKFRPVVEVLEQRRLACNLCSPVPALRGPESFDGGGSPHDWIEVVSLGNATHTPQSNPNADLIDLAIVKMQDSTSPELFPFGKNPEQKDPSEQQFEFDPNFFSEGEDAFNYQRIEFKYEPVGDQPQPRPTDPKPDQNSSEEDFKSGIAQKIQQALADAINEAARQEAGHQRAGDQPAK